MKILLDENLPRKLVSALRAEGHEVESVHTLRLQGLENGKLYSFAQDSFDLCFTRECRVCPQCTPGCDKCANEITAGYLTAKAAG